MSRQPSLPTLTTEGTWRGPRDNRELNNPKPPDTTTPPVGVDVTRARPHSQAPIPVSNPPRSFSRRTP
jgi:hypothetical protein